MFSFLEQLSVRLSGWGRHTVASFVDLETIQDDQTLMTGEGGLVSLIEIEGFRGILGNQEMTILLDTLVRGLNPFFSKSGYALQLWYHREEGLDVRSFDLLQARVRQGASRFQLDLEDLFLGQRERLSIHGLSDRFYLALWTRPEALSKEDLKKNRQSRYEASWLSMTGSQDLLVGLQDLSVLHESYRQGVVALFDRAGVRVKSLNVRQALQAVRSSLYPGRDFTAWQAYLPGDRLRIGTDFRHGEDTSSLLWPSLPIQLCDEAVEELSRTMVKCGDRLCSSIDMTLAPLDVMPLSSLLAVLSQSGTPFRFSLLLESQDWRLLQMKEMMAKLLEITSPGKNRLIIQAIESVKSCHLTEPHVSMRASFATWAPEKELLRRRVSLLSQAVEGWGGCQVTREGGDPLEMLMSSALAIACRSTAPRVAIPLKEALKMAPLQAGSSPFSQGSSVLLSEDGKPWVYDGRSSEFTRLLEIFVGAPRSGKSVKANESILKEILCTPLIDLPYVGIIDIGLSSSGAISLLKEALPEDKRSQVGFFKLHLRPQDAINPLDTPLGCRKPLPQGRSFAVNFLLTLLAPVEGGAVPGEMADLVSHVMDEIYKNSSDLEKGASPKRYTPGREREIDRILQEESLSLPSGSLWWDVVDVLFQVGHVSLAKRAQRYAIPTLSDAAQAVRSSQINDIFKNTRLGQSQESVIEGFERMLSSLLREFPNLSLPTQFDLQETRICALDLGEVAPSGSGKAQKQSAVMYMLARHALVQDWTIGEEVLSEVSALYRDWYREILTRQRAIPKTLFIDEYHRTGGLENFRRQMVRDALEGPKWGLKLMLSSQSLDHFDEEILRIATAVWIMDVGSKKDYIRSVSQKTGLSETAQYIAEHYLTGPSERGTPLLLRLYTRRGAETHFLRFVMSGIELWALSTTPEDVVVREKLYEKFGPQKARRLLAHHYPGGTIRKELERRQDRQRAHGGVQMEGNSTSLLDQIADEIGRGASA